MFSSNQKNQKWLYSYQKTAERLILKVPQCHKLDLSTIECNRTPQVQTFFRLILDYYCQKVFLELNDKGQVPLSYDQSEEKDTFYGFYSLSFYYFSKVQSTRGSFIQKPSIRDKSKLFLKLKFSWSVLRIWVVLKIPKNFFASGFTFLVRQNYLEFCQTSHIPNRPLLGPFLPFGLENYDYDGLFQNLIFLEMKF